MTTVDANYETAVVLSNGAGIHYISSWLIQFWWICNFYFIPKFCKWTVFESRFYTGSISMFY